MEIKPGWWTGGPRTQRWRTVRLRGLDALSGPGKKRIFRRVDFGHSYITNIVPATKWGHGLWAGGKILGIGQVTAIHCRAPILRNEIGLNAFQIWNFVKYISSHQSPNGVVYRSAPDSAMALKSLLGIGELRSWTIPNELFNAITLTGAEQYTAPFGCFLKFRKASKPLKHTVGGWSVPCA